MPKCPGITLHCPGCTNGSGVAAIVIGGAAIGALVWLADRALAAATPVIAGAAPYIDGLCITALTGALAFVIIAVRRERARLTWLRAGLPPSRVRARVPVREAESVPVLPVMPGLRPLARPGTVPLSVASEPAQVLSLRLAPPADRDASRAGQS